MAFVWIADAAARFVPFDDPPVTVRFAATSFELNEEMAAFGQPSNDLLNAVLGDATFCGEMSDAGPGEAFPFIDEIGEHIGESKGERREFWIGVHLLEPEEFFAVELRGVSTVQLLLASERVGETVRPLQAAIWGRRGQAIFEHPAKIG